MTHPTVHDERPMSILEEAVLQELFIRYQAFNCTTRERGREIMEELKSAMTWAFTQGPEMTEAYMIAGRQLLIEVEKLVLINERRVQVRQIREAMPKPPTLPPPASSPPPSSAPACVIHPSFIAPSPAPTPTPAPPPMDDQP